MMQTENQTVTVKAWRSILALMLLSGLVVLCYFFVDRPVAWLVHHYSPIPDSLIWHAANVAGRLNRAMFVGSIVAVFVALVWRGKQQRLILALAISLLATAECKDWLKWACGRQVPLTWYQDNQDAGPLGICEFHPFHTRGAFQAFPSGHASVTFSLVSILWLARPGWRRACLAVVVLICGPLIALNYHFLSDVIAGAMLGTTIGVATAAILRVPVTE